ncbi:hypothetical protein ACHAWF_007538 [Thalassiosira exigua]
MAPNVTEVRDSAFEGCPNLKEVDLGNVTKIGECSFWRCRSLLHLRLPRTITEVGARAFLFCRKLKQLDFSNVAEIKIGEGAFASCESLVRLCIPHTLIELGDFAFEECSGLKEVYLGNVIKIGVCAFESCFSLVSLNLPPSVAEIGRGAFRDCLFLKELDLSHLGLLKIEKETFKGCILLESLALPNTLLVIEKQAFHTCDELQNLTIPPTLKEIGESAFQGCRSLVAVHFGQGVHHVGDQAFDDCISLGSINIAPNSFVIEWGDDPSCTLAKGTSFPSADGGVERTVISRYLGQSKRFLAEVEEKINGILGRQDRTKEEKLDMIRSMITHVKMVDAATCLELALLKSSMDREWNLTSAPITRKRRRETRVCSRVICGAEIIIPNVLRFLDGS